jgi:hypothetical protein
MTKSQKDSCVVAVRLPPEERVRVAALAATEGKAISTYIRDVLSAAAAKPRPVLAAGGALLGICDTLLGASRRASLDRDTQCIIEEQARLVIDIIRLHDLDDLA